MVTKTLNPTFFCWAGLNAAIRGVAKAALQQGSKVIGVQDGFRGLVENGTVLIEEPVPSRLAREIQQAAGIEVRFTSLGHVQRGGTPTATDRLLCTRLGTKAGELLAEGTYNVMVGVKGDECVAVPLADVAGKTKLVPPNHAWLKTAALVDTCLGDQL